MDEQLVTNPEALRILADPTARRFLEPFIGRRRETAQAARDVGVPVETMAYRVDRLRRLGLLTGVGERIHAGRPVTMWSAPAAYRCPLDALPEADVTTAFSLVDQPGREAFLAALARAAIRDRQVQWDLRVYRQEPDGGVRVSVHPRDTTWLPGEAAVGAPAVVFAWAPAALTADQARLVQQRLLAVLDELPVDPAAPTHLCGLFLSPIG